jgi:hypothetical protein
MMSDEAMQVYYEGNKLYSTGHFIAQHYVDFYGKEDGRSSFYYPDDQTYMKEFNTLSRDLPIDERDYGAGRSGV